MASSVVRRDSLADPRHLLRFMKYQALAGTETERVEAIAKTEGVSARVVKDSITKIAVYHSRNSQPEMEFAIRDLVISAIPQAKKTLAGLLEATELVEVKDNRTGKNKVIRQEDKTTRIEAMKIVNQMVANAQPKAPPVEVNVKQNNQVVTAISTAETPEERIRRLRVLADKENQKPPEIAGVPIHIDQESDGPDDDDDDEGDEEEEE